MLANVKKTSGLAMPNKFRPQSRNGIVSSPFSAAPTKKPPAAQCGQCNSTRELPESQGFQYDIIDNRGAIAKSLPRLRRHEFDHRFSKIGQNRRSRFDAERTNARSCVLGEDVPR